MENIPFSPLASSTPPDTAVVLVNLGTPAAPTPAAVRRYLTEFLSDRRVVALPALFWQPLLRAVVLPLRCKRVAGNYAKIWLDDGSPLSVYTRRIAAAVQSRLPGVRVVDAMRYGEPALAGVLEGLRSDGVRNVLVLPLYPQYSTSTTAAVEDVVARAQGLRARVINNYHVDPDWIGAIADSVSEHRQVQDDGEHLLFSFHGLPKRLIRAGDPYQAQCEAGARAIADALGLASSQWSIAYQSRFGSERWLEPSTSDRLKELAAMGIRQVDVIAPGFSVDCLETLEEVSMMLADEFAGAGGTLRYIPCLNDRPGHARALAAIVGRELAGFSPATDHVHRAQ